MGTQMKGKPPVKDKLTKETTVLAKAYDKLYEDDDEEEYYPKGNGVSLNENSIHKGILLLQDNNKLFSETCDSLQYILDRLESSADDSLVGRDSSGNIGLVSELLEGVDVYGYLNTKAAVLVKQITERL